MENKQTAMQLVDFSNPNADKIKSASTSKPMQNKQTAVEWLYDQIWKTSISNWHELLNHAKQMEKQQIIEARHNGVSDAISKGYTMSHEDYYNKIYKSE